MAYAYFHCMSQIDFILFFSLKLKRIPIDPSGRRNENINKYLKVPPAIIKKLNQNGTLSSKPGLKKCNFLV